VPDGRDRPLSESLIGTWELLSREDHTSIGERRIDASLGENPVALLIYDRSGHFAAQFMKRDRDAVSDADGPAAAPNNSQARGGYDAYFGTYTIDDARSTVTQTLTGALSPENVGQVLTRVMTVVGDELTIRLETATRDDEPVTRTLRWKRVGATEE
jgi:lipocalin-like protein